MKIEYNKNFIKLYSKNNIKIKNKFQNRLRLFMSDPFLPELNNHALSWKYLWKRSINITGDYRAIFKELSNWNYEFIEFTNIWTHSQLYK